MIDDNNVEGLVQHSKELQVEQANVIRRLQVAQRSEATRDIIKFSPGDWVVISTKVSPPIGKVTSTNDSIRTVISITPKRVKIRTDSGFTYRALRNLRKAKGVKSHVRAASSHARERHWTGKRWVRQPWAWQRQTPQQAWTEEIQREEVQRQEAHAKRECVRLQQRHPHKAIH